MHKLIISSWIGLSPEAVHYIGILEGYDYSGKWKSVNVDYILDASRAAELNTTYKKQFPGDDMIPFRVGMKSDKFDTVDDVIKAGRSASMIHFPGSRMSIVYP